MVGASFRFGGYRSSAQYFSRARKEHIRVTGMPAPAAVELAIRDAIRSIDQGMGANAAKDAFRLDALDFDFTSKGASFSLAHGMVVLGSWFLCREIELANLRVKHMAVDTVAKQVTLTLASSKTDTVGSLVHRKHSCYCGVVRENICPYHAALRIADECSVDSETGRSAQQAPDHRAHPRRPDQAPRTSPTCSASEVIASGCRARNICAACAYLCRPSCSSGDGGAEQSNATFKKPSSRTSTRSRRLHRP